MTQDLQGCNVDWQSLGIVSGAALIGVSGLEALATIVGNRSRTSRLRRRYQDQRTRFEKQLAGELKYARATKPIYRAWAGERPFRVAAIVDEAVGYKSFYLVAADGRALPRFEPGQYLTFSLPVDPHRKPIVRCYSLSDRPREDYYRVTIKRSESPLERADLPSGQGSSYFHHRAKVGSELKVQAPQGAFFLDPTDHLPIVLIAGGVGITPLLSMASSIVHERSSRSVYFFAGFRNSSEHPFKKQIASLAQAENIHSDITYSRPLADDRLGRDYQYQGHISIVRLRQLLPSSNFRFYLCGPAGMMEQLVPGLLNWGVPEKHIHFEAFGPASVKSLHKKGNTLCQPCRVEFTKSNTELLWKGDFSDLLDLAEDAGLVLDSGCRAGNCGQCLVKVRSGKVAHSKTPGVPLGDDECLTCIGQPQGEVVLDA
ncbi:2Fe-2S iron-sulfur cluster-binding protein [Bythopirellula polymerisocia]|uniref:Flavohemoprotein n=1 Tax=Bythopirellula polymerisocia TaxID=2528003 RepID=A0A5C6CNG0_9BACT|nr:2Fe-2S iron-sulfur cluster-binding protein [Bythopirellula polymerisocia]TWU24586.1 Flavohemoprotein [Bythopirellula polymerisocia]